MKKEWFAAKELTGVAGLPSSPQGINLMARREGWISRRRKGVQGKALEYHIDSLPTGTRNLLILKEDPALYEVERKDPLTVWIEYYYHLTESEREKMLAFLMREGIGAYWRVSFRGNEQTRIAGLWKLQGVCYFLKIALNRKMG